MTVKFDPLTIDWLGYATARVAARNGSVVYTDPGRYGVLDGYEARDGDVVLVTHDHHYDPDGIDRVAGADATVVVFEAVDADRIDRPVRPVDELDHDVRRVAVGDSMTLLEGQVSIDVTPAQNHLEDGRDSTSVSHPPGFGCGYRFTIAETHVFWPGDTDLMETFADLDVDLLLANIGGSVVMDRHDAVILAEWLDPGLVVPIHYDTIEMLEADARSFAADVAERSIPVALDEGDH